MTDTTWEVDEMEYYEVRTQFETDMESQGPDAEEDFQCLNYYPGMIAEWNEEEQAYREELFAIEFFGDAECFETAHP